MWDEQTLAEQIQNPLGWPWIKHSGFSNHVLTWSWFFSKLLIMKNTYTGYTRLPGKKNELLWKSHPEKPQGHKMKQSVPHLWSVQAPWKKQKTKKLVAGTSPHTRRSCLEIPDRQLPRNRPSTPIEGLRFKRSDFCNENFKFQETTCFSNLDFHQQWDGQKMWHLDTVESVQLHRMNHGTGDHQIQKDKHGISPLICRI